VGSNLTEGGGFFPIERNLRRAMDVYPWSRAAHKKEKRGKNKPTARYLIDQYGEKGKAKKKPE
jgi:hypothetical protein